MNKINIYVIRHGESTINVLKDRIGQPADTNLTRKGFQQAKILGKTFKLRSIAIDHIFSSSYVRAKDTAITFADNYEFKDEIKFSDALVEYNAGDWIGKSRGEIFSDPKNSLELAAKNMDFKYPNGDTLHQVQRRVMQWIEETLTHNVSILENLNDKSVNVCLFSHGQAIKCLLQNIMNFDQSFIWKIKLENTSVTHLSYTRELGWFVNTINDTSHLL